MRVQQRGGDGGEGGWRVLSLLLVHLNQVPENGSWCFNATSTYFARTVNNWKQHLRFLLVARIVQAKLNRPGRSPSQDRRPSGTAHLRTALLGQVGLRREVLTAAEWNLGHPSVAYPIAGTLDKPPGKSPQPAPSVRFCTSKKLVRSQEWISTDYRASQ